MRRSARAANAAALREQRPVSGCIETSHETVARRETPDARRAANRACRRGFAILRSPWLDLACMAAPRCPGSPSAHWRSGGWCCRRVSSCRGRKASRATPPVTAPARCCAATAPAAASAPSGTRATSPPMARPPSPAPPSPAAASPACPAARAHAARRMGRAACSWVSRPARAAHRRIRDRPRGGRRWTRFPRTSAGRRQRWRRPRRRRR
jgi:hypothetical protein